MNSANVLRSIAVVLAVAAIADPACTRRTFERAPVLVRAASHQAADRRLAESVRAHLASALRGQIDADAYGSPAAVVVAGELVELETLPGGTPVSTVTETAPEAPNVRVVGVSAPPVMRPGWTASLSATLIATGMAGRTSVIALEHGDVEVGRLVHKWTSDSETFQAAIPYIPPAAGVSSMRIIAQPLAGEATSADNHADLRAVVEDRALNVLVLEPRPSWGTTFLRRVLEKEPLFDVAGLVRPTPGIEIHAGAAPERLLTGTLETFDAVIVGAPEELSDAEVSALERFARLRGGTFLLVPDRRPAGPYVRLIPAATFEERLLAHPIVASGSAGSLQASELAVPVRTGPAVDTLAGLSEADQRMPIVISWPVGAGRGMYSGALDAWRYRAPGDGFAKFWRAHVAAAASSAPPRLETVLDPGVASPGQIVTILVRVRRTEFAETSGALLIPVVSAQVTGRGGAVEPVRLWPAEEAGVFEGRFEAPEPGQHAIRVWAGSRLAVDTILIVSPEARTGSPAGHTTERLLVDATGGSSAARDDLSAVASHLARLPRASVARAVRPARSPWWMGAFVLLLCVEWTSRRRGGAR